MNENESLLLVEEKNCKKPHYVSCVKRKNVPKDILRSTKNGRSNISTASNLLKDYLLQDSDPEDLESIHYH